MTKEEMIILLKKYKENVAKLRMRKKEKKYYQNILNSGVHIDVSFSGSGDVNSGIRSKNKINDNVSNSVVNAIRRNEISKEEAKSELIAIEDEITILEDKIEDAEIILGCLSYKETEIMTAFYVEKRAADDIAKNLYFRLFGRECSQKNVYKIIKDSTKKILNLQRK